MVFTFCPAVNEYDNAGAKSPYIRSLVRQAKKKIVGLRRHFYFYGSDQKTAGCVRAIPIP